MEIRAILTCVDYWDLLTLTLPYNTHHFSEVFIVTHPKDHDTQEIAFDCGAKIILTELFYESGALDFNKWRALEYGLDVMGREGWICVMDADIFWPSRANFNRLEIGKLLTPYRRLSPASLTIPPEPDWLQFPRHRNTGEWAGYTQIFHGSDPHLTAPPWYETRWKHAGGADSFFQRKWPGEAKVRPDWEVLHVGSSGVNWLGRTTDYLDGTSPKNSRETKKRLKEMLSERRNNQGGDPFSHEKY